MHYFYDYSLYILYGIQNRLLKSNIYIFKSNTFFTVWNIPAKGLGLRTMGRDQEAHHQDIGLEDRPHKGEGVEGPIQESELNLLPTQETQEVL